MTERVENRTAVAVWRTGYLLTCLAWLPVVAGLVAWPVLGHWIWTQVGIAGAVLMLLVSAMLQPLYIRLRDRDQSAPPPSRIVIAGE